MISCDIITFILISVIDTVIVVAAYITCNMLYIVKTGKGHSKETKEQDTVDGGQRRKGREKCLREDKGRETQEIERLHKHLYLIKKHIFCSTFVKA